MSYVDAGYAIALAALFLYAVGLVLRRRRWARALEVSLPPPSPPRAEDDGAPAGVVQP